MHVVFLAYHYPPTTEVGALRTGRVAAALLERGHRVTVIRARTNDSEVDVAQVGRLHTVLTVTPLPAPRDWFREFKKAFSSIDSSTAAASGGETWSPPQEIGLLKRLAYSLMRLPDDKQGFIWPAAKAASAVAAADESPVLYTSGPPPSTHLAGLLVNLTLAVPWILEFRDPWTENPGKPWFARTRITDQVETWLERLCLRRAAGLVSVTQAIDRRLGVRLSGTGTPRVVVRNGIEGLRAVGGEADLPPRIVYAGSFYLSRDPSPFLLALAAVARRSRLGPQSLRVEFIGHCAYFRGQSTKDLVASLGLSEFVELVPWLPRDETKRRLERATLLLLLAAGQPEQVPQKLYEYLATRRPILAFVDGAGETASMLRQLGGHTVVAQRADSDLAEAAIENAAFGGVIPPTCDEQLLNQWTVDRQMVALTDFVESIGRQGHTHE